MILLEGGESPSSFYFMKKQIQIDLSKKYCFPQIIEVEYKGKILAISPETANWIVLDNENQLKFFRLLQVNSIQEALSQAQVLNNDSNWVIAQIEARKLDNYVVQNSILDIQSLHFYITNVCNLRCPHCYMRAGERFEEELCTDEIKNVLSEFKQCGGEKVTFTGGEVATRKDFVEIVQYAASVGLQSKILSNGVLWRQDMVDDLSDMISSIQFSVDGYDEESNQRIRGVNSFKATLKTIDKFVAKGVQVDVAVTPFFDGDLVNHIQDYALFAKSLTDKYDGEKFVIRFSHELLDGREIELTDEERAEYGKIIDKIYSAYYGTDVSYYPFIGRFKEHRILENCMFGHLSISATGDIFLCSRIPSVASIGNVRAMSMDTIMKKAKTAQSLSNINNLRPCNTCELKYICGGGCRIDYFPELTTCSDIEKLNPLSIPPRKCSMKEKEYYYDIMIRTNEMLFR